MDSAVLGEMDSLSAISEAVNSLHMRLTTSYSLSEITISLLRDGAFFILADVFLAGCGLQNC
jgi:hypothetical protein